jgi:hypothetical protein
VATEKTALSVVTDHDETAFRVIEYGKSRKIALPDSLKCEIQGTKLQRELRRRGIGQHTIEKGALLLNPSRHLQENLVSDWRMQTAKTGWVLTGLAMLRRQPVRSQRGRVRSHPRHWQALAELVGVSVEMSVMAILRQLADQSELCCVDVDLRLLSFFVFASDGLGGFLIVQLVPCRNSRQE